MGYRHITVESRKYRFKVGSKNVEIRDDDDGESFKVVVPKPTPQKRWGVIYPNLDTDTLSISIFTSWDEAFAEHEERKKSFSGDAKGLVELARLNDEIIPVTPGWVRGVIAANLTTAQE